MSSDELYLSYNCLSSDEFIEGTNSTKRRIVLNFYRGMNSFFSDEFFLSEEILYRGTNFFKRRILFER